MTEPNVVEAFGELSDWFSVLVEAREELKGWKEREEEAKAQITRILQARDSEVQVNGRTILKAVNRPGSHSLNTAKLKVDMPDVYKRYQKQNAGSYRLELVDPDEANE